VSPQWIALIFDGLQAVCGIAVKLLVWSFKILIDPICRLADGFVWPSGEVSAF